MDPNPNNTPIERAAEWVSEPHPELADTILAEAKTGWTWETAMEVWGPLYPFSVLIFLLLFVGVAYCALRIRQIRNLEQMAFRRTAHPVAHEDLSRTQLRWRRVMENANGEDEHKWRLAILEADIMLNDLLDVLGYKGETMAEKLKRVNKSQFNSIDAAWEAHRMRNRVAHESAETPLTEREKNIVIGQFASVFREFKLID